MVLGNDPVPCCPPYRPRQGCSDLRVCISPSCRVYVSLTLFSHSLWTKYTVAAIPGSFVFTMLFLPLYAVVAPAIGFSTEYKGIVPRLWTNWVFYLVLLLVPIVCLTRDFVWK